MAFVCGSTQMESDTAPSGQEPWGGDDVWRMRKMGTATARSAFFEALPGLKGYRVPFNVDQFDENGEWADSSMHDMIYEMLAQGYVFLFDLHDGPTQELDDPGRRSGWPHLYPDTTNWTDQDWHDYVKPGGPLELTRVTAAWAAMLNWLDNNPLVDAAVYGFESINEPDTWNRFDKAVGDEDSALGYYGEITLNIYNQIVASGRSGFKFFVCGFGYSAKFEELAKPVSYLGGKSVIDYLREAVAGSNNQLGWAIHSPDGDRFSPKAYYDSLDKRYRMLLAQDEPMSVTEINLNGGWVRWDFLDNYYRNLFMLGQAGPWFRDREVSFVDWPLNNYASARLINVDASGEIELDNPATYWGVNTIWSLSDRTGPSSRAPSTVTSRPTLRTA